MKIELHSFRVRLILLMVLLSGGALISFGFVTWRVLLKERNERLDLSLESHVYRYAEPFIMESYRPSAHIPTDDQFNVIKEMNETDLQYLLLRQDGKIIRLSSGWPSEMDVEPFITRAEFTDRPLNGFRPPRMDGGDRGPPPRNGDDPRARRPPPRNNGGGDRPPPPGDEDDRPPKPEEDGDPDRRREGDPRRGPPDLRDPAPRNFVQFDSAFIENVKTDNGTWRVMGVPAEAHVVLFAQSKELIATEMRDLRHAFLLAMPLALILIAAGASWLASQAIKPVTRLTESAEKTTAQGLGERIPAEGSAVEFSKLVSVYNDMLSRLELSFNQASRFSADAAHELNTPLTILLGHMDDALQSAETNSEEQVRYGLLMEEVQRLKGIVDKLLLLSRADSGQIKHLRKRFCFSDLIFEVAEDAGEIAPDLSVNLNVPNDIQIEGDPELLRQVIFNLMSNAIKYNENGGFVEIDLTVDRVERSTFLTVTNSGEAIPEESAKHIFDRFYRVDPTRNRKVYGLGLGLPLAKEFTELHQGKLELTQNTNGRVSFTITLPAVV